MKRLSLILVTMALSAAAPAAQVDLRGYGKVTASFAPGRVTFLCESAEKASILQGKLLADLFWDAGSDHVEKSLVVKGVSLRAHLWPPYGAIIAARIGSQVMVVGGVDEAALVKLAGAEPLLLRQDAALAPAGEYPRYLDMFDLRAYKAYTHAMASKDKQGLDSHWPFVKEFGLGGLAFQTLSIVHTNPQRGVIETTATDYEVKEAERAGGMVVPGILGGGAYPLWVFNEFPGVFAEPTPTTLFGNWGGAGATGSHYQSWGMPLETMAATGLAYLKQTMQRYLRSPAVGGWMLYSGAPGAEMAMHSRAAMYWDYSPMGQKEFRRWLREVRGFSLQEMGRRWYGDSRRFSSWEQIAMPDLNEFYVGTEPGSVRLAGNWKFQVASEGVAEPPAANDPKWIPLEMPPSQQGNLLPRGPSFYRTVFSGEPWLKPGRELYLVCVANNIAREGVSIWLNGKLLGQFKATDNTIGGLQVKIHSGVKPGENELAFKIPSEIPDAEGRMIGPVYLSPVAPKFYPFLGKQLNARYADLRLFQGYGVLRVHQPVMEMARAIDPDRPFVLSPGSDASTADAAAQLAVRYGASLQNTGREAYTFPYLTGYGYVGGFYGTSEPSATVRDAKLDRMFGMTQFDGDSNHVLFWDVENYIRYEKETGWFTKHARQIELFGKALRDNPRLVLYRSSRNALLGSPNFSKWDIGNADMQAAHYDNVYANDSDVLSGRVDDYPVLWDTGDEFMQPDIVDALTRYVRNGGTFIATHITGRHSLEELDAYPIGKLLGCTLKNVKPRGKLRFGQNLPILAAYAGREFDASGIALTPVAGADPLVGLARWEDGSVAIGVRKLGKGRVIVLGSGFWRDNSFRQEFYDKVLAELGIGRTATSSSASVWTHKFVTKNGLQDWVIAFNSTDAAQTADLAYKAASKPSAVWNMTSRKPVEYRYTEDGWVHIAKAQIDPQSIAVFGSPRGSLVDGLPVWWGEKKKYWKHADAVEPVVPVLPRAAIPMTQWRFATDPEGKLSSAGSWKTVEFADGGWRSVPSGLWDLIFDDPALRAYHGVALYRNTFTLPENWKNHRITLNLESYDTPIVYDTGEFYVNGELVTTYKARGWAQFYNYDVTRLLRPGRNVLALKVTGGQKFSGLSGPVWLQAEQILAPAMDLAGNWEAVKADFLTREAAVLPGTVKAKYLARTVAVPASWTGKTVYLHLETSQQWLGSVVVNGQLINFNGSLHPYPLRTEINITSYLKPGMDNRVELWPYKTIPGFRFKNALEEEKIEVVAVRIGVVSEAETGRR